MGEPQPANRKASVNYNSSGQTPVFTQSGIRNVSVGKKSTSDRNRVVSKDKSFAANDPRHANLTRNVHVTGRHSNPTTDQLFRERSAERVIQPKSIARNKKKMRKHSTAGSLASKMTAGGVRNATTQRFINRAGANGEKIEKAQLIKDRARAAIVSWKMIHVGGYFWLFVQLPIAVTSTISFITALLVDQEKQSYLYDAYATAKTGLSYLNWVPGANVLSGLKSLVEFALLQSLGIDINLNDPRDLFLFTYFLIIILALFQYLIIYLLYKLRGIQPIFGSGGGSKSTVLLLSFIGYCLPVVNLVPWIVFWVFKVIKNPK